MLSQSSLQRDRETAIVYKLATTAGMQDVSFEQSTFYWTNNFQFMKLFDNETFMRIAVLCK
jgi:hypothetical protein